MATSRDTKGQSEPMHADSESDPHAVPSTSDLSHTPQPDGRAGASAKPASEADRGIPSVASTPESRPAVVDRHVAPGHTLQPPVGAHGDAHVVNPDANPNETYATLLLESGGRVEAAEPHARAFRVRASGGAMYEHCGEGPGGEWVYRAVK